MTRLQQAPDAGTMNTGSRGAVRPGGIAQLVEHYAGSVRVRSSSLLASTKNLASLGDGRSLYSGRCVERARVVHHAAFYRRADVAKLRNVIERSSVHHDRIGELPGA